MKKIFAIMFCLSALTLSAQKDSVFTIDLGQEKVIEYTTRLDKSFRISINNVLPSKDYTISYEFKKDENVENLGKLLMQNSSSIDFMSFIVPSRGLVAETFRTTLDTLTNEAQVSVFSQKVTEALSSPDIDSISKIELMEIKKSVNKEYDKAFRIKKPDENLVMTIKRTDLYTEDAWQITVKPEKIGEFKITYGFSVISPVLTAYDRYEYNYVGNDEYMIESVGKPDWNEFIYNPTVNIVWYRNKARSMYGLSAFNPTIGFGLSMTSSDYSEVLNPNVFAGVTFSVQRALNFSLGIAMHQFKTLDDSIDITKTYESDFVSDSQLMTKSVYAFNPAFSITFNISDN